jgi:hypothetical protein
MNSLELIGAGLALALFFYLLVALLAPASNS